MATSSAPLISRLGQQALRSTLSLARRFDEPRLERTVAAPRHPLQPAAIRVERSHSSNAEGKASQNAVTVWFGEGPALPTPGSASPAVRSALRVGAGVLGAAALAALTTVAAQREARLSEARNPRLRTIDAPR